MIYSQATHRRRARIWIRRPSASGRLKATSPCERPPCPSRPVSFTTRRTDDFVYRVAAAYRRHMGPLDLPLEARYSGAPCRDALQRVDAGLPSPDDLRVARLRLGRPPPSGDLTSHSFRMHSPKYQRLLTEAGVGDHKAGCPLGRRSHADVPCREMAA